MAEVTADMSEDDVGKNLLQVIEKSREWGDKIPIGVFYQNETVPIYEERLSERSPSYLKEPSLQDNSSPRTTENL